MSEITIDDNKERTIIKIDGFELPNITSYQINRDVEELGIIEVSVKMKFKHDSLLITSKDKQL